MPKTVAIAAANSGAANMLVAAVTGQVIRVLAYKLSFSGTVNAKFQSGAATDLTGLIYGTAAKDSNSPRLPQAGTQGRPVAQFETAAGEDLTLNLSGATAVGGWLMYETLPANLAQS